jgi:DNA topoisomerase-1
VQSPALRMIVEREEEIEAFKAREYWTVEADCAHPDLRFTARLTKLHGKKFEQFDLTNEADAHAARDALLKSAQGRLVVSEVQSKERKRRPSPPFTTSTLQQEAARKLGFSTSRTMRLAQGLYEGVTIGGEGTVGLITYMRTDSVHLANDAIAEIRKVIARDFGARALPEHPNFYRAKSKNAQEAHEAIRPTSALHTPASVAGFLNDDQRKLYDLIWKRAVASQMQYATLNTVSVDLDAGNASTFRASGTTVVDPGFLAVYEEGRDQKNTEDDDENRKLPAMTPGEAVPLAGVLAEQHFTEPPPRYSEASLVKALEEYGIGRPSTYASIIGTLQARKYVELENRRFRPTDVGRAVSKFLSAHFTQYVDYDFTAKLEDELDAVSRGEEAWVPLMDRFWKSFKTLVDDKKDNIDRADAGSVRVLGPDPKTGRPVSARIGKFGPLVQIGTSEDEEKPQFASLKPGQSIYSISLEEALELFGLPRTLGESKGEKVTVGIGRFGAFAKRGSTYASLAKEDDPYAITFERAVELIEQKEEIARNRIIKQWDGYDVQVLNGRFGPYLSDGKMNGRIPKDRDPASLSLVEAQQMLEATGKPVRARFAKKATKKVAAKKAVAKKSADTAAKKAPAKKAATKKSPAKKAAKKATAKKAAKSATKKVVKKAAATAVATDDDTPF